MKDVQYLGLWWSPTNEADKVSGTITFSEDRGISLNLIGSLSGNRYFGAPEHYSTILGQTNSGQFITLRSCQQVKYQLGAPGFAVEDIVADEMYVGKHHSTLDLQQFHRTKATYTYLTNWYGFSGFDGQEKYTLEHILEKFELQYVFPDPVKVKVFDTSISISHTFHRNLKLFGADLYEEVTVTFESQQELTMEQWQKKWLRPLQNFLTFATGKPNRITGITVFSRKSDRLVDNGKVVPRPITVYYRQPSVKAQYYEKLAKPDMLFSYQDIKDDIQKILYNWFRVSDSFETVSSLLFVTQYSLMPILNPRFLSVSQAVEIFHRRKYSSHVMQKERYKNFVRLIIRQAIPSQRDWLRKKLQHANEPSLFTRVNQLLDVADEVMTPLVGNTERFARKVADTRNYLTHYSPKLKNKAASDIELYWMIEALVILVQWSLLVELGVSPEQCTALFKENRNYQHVLKESPKY